MEIVTPNDVRKSLRRDGVAVVLAPEPNRIARVNLGVVPGEPFLGMFTRGCNQSAIG